MAKKKKNLSVIQLDNEGILNECATSLMMAFDFAIEHRDVETMLSVSDRWLRLYATLSNEELSKETLKLGFVDDSSEI